MPSTLIYMESANLFVGEDDPTNSKHLQIEEVKLPNLERIYAEHNAGGAPFSIDMRVGIQKIEASFKLKGIDNDLMARFGGPATIFTIYGNMLNSLTGEESAGSAIIRGELGKNEYDAFKRGEMMSVTYSIMGISRYKVQMSGNEILYASWEEGIFRTPIWNNDVARRNLGLAT